jgi:hypothetical protein
MMWKMKYSGILALILPFMGFIFHSCDKLDAPYSSAKHGNVVDTVMDWDTVNPVKRVLLEDYTGHKCTNCPDAAVIAHSLENTYDGKLLVMAVHAGYYAEPDQSGNFTTDYTTPTGDSWNNQFGIVSNPSGMVDRKDFGSGNVLEKEVWSNAVAQEINKSPDAFIVIVNNFNPETKTLNSTVYTQFLTQLQGTFKLCLCITEDSLYSAQKNNNPAVGTVPVIDNYLFMDVLRGAINGTWGEILSSSVNIDLTYLYRFKFILNSAWNPDHCWLYAFVFRDDTKEIIQVERKRITL